jgi:hypothetical protein
MKREYTFWKIVKQLESSLLYIENEIRYARELYEELTFALHEEDELAADTKPN